jgi:hypothetical protein
MHNSTPTILYLHGHRSSPSSTKATFFKAKCAGEGWQLHAPILGAPDGPSVLITEQLALLSKEVQMPPTVVMGSSLGAYVAMLHAAEHEQVRGLVLLSPSLNLSDTLGSLSAEQLSTLNVTSAFLQDLKSYPPEPEFQQRALIFHGQRDTPLSLQYSREYARRRGLYFQDMESGHRLDEPETMERMWSTMRKFIADVLKTD